MGQSIEGSALLVKFPLPSSFLVQRELEVPRGGKQSYPWPSAKPGRLSGQADTTTG